MGELDDTKEMKIADEVNETLDNTQSKKRSNQSKNFLYGIFLILLVLIFLATGIIIGVRITKIRNLKAKKVINIEVKSNPFEINLPIFKKAAAENNIINNDNNVVNDGAATPQMVECPECEGEGQITITSSQTSEEPCSECGGDGVIGDDDIGIICESCQGTGVVEVAISSATKVTCPNCDGTGQIESE